MSTNKDDCQPIGGPAKASWESLQQGALDHYEQLATKAHHWSSFIPAAIKAYREWVSVKDGLPSDGQGIIFFTTGYSIGEMRMGCFLKKDQWDRPNMFVADGYFYETHVSHWMPTPKPPNP